MKAVRSNSKPRESQASVRQSSSWSDSPALKLAGSSTGRSASETAFFALLATLSRVPLFDIPPGKPFVEDVYGIIRMAMESSHLAGDERRATRANFPRE